MGLIIPSLIFKAQYLDLETIVVVTGPLGPKSLGFER